MQRTFLDVVAHNLPAGGTILAPGRAARDLHVEGARVLDRHPSGAEPASIAGVVLLDDQVSDAGDHAEELIDTIGTVLEPGGALAATVRNRVFADATGGTVPGNRAYSAAELTKLLEQRGFSITILCAPGAAARLRGDDTFDLDADRQPGLLDAAPRLLVVARAPRNAQERSAVFFASRPRKIAAAATICRHPDGRMLVVYDRFQRMWTIPGGVVDPDEDPASAARRETWEEGGTKVETGQLLGVFAGRWPDRLIFVFASEPTTLVEHPEPVHGHEICEVAWLPVEQALQRLAPRIAFQVRRCLEQPGYTWTE
jgi:8-oxo-dGTP pyrophosphatase MutT (NUDIX family)